VQESNLLGTRATGSSLANWPVAVPATLHNSLNPEEPKRVERSKPISRTCPLSRREGLPLAQQLHFNLGGGERENRTPVALIALTSAFQAGTLPLGHLSTEEPGRVERPWPITRTNPLSRREGLPLAQQLHWRAVKESNLHIRIFGVLPLNERPKSGPGGSRNPTRWLQAISAPVITTGP
jgi:hypothetical protein